MAPPDTRAYRSTSPLAGSLRRVPLSGPTPTGGQQNNADSLSRRVAASHAPPAGNASPATQTDRIDWPTSQQRDPIVGEVYRLVQAGTPPPTPESTTDRSAEAKSLFSQMDRLTISTDGILRRTFVNPDTGSTHGQIIVAYAERRPLADDLHRGLKGGHLGLRRSKQLLQKRYYWPGLSLEVALAKSRCHQCARHQRPRPHRQGSLQPMLTGEPWERLGIDVIGPHPTSAKGNVYILTIIDHFTKWVELFPMRNQEAAAIAKILFDHVICVHGCPLQILTDQGANFGSDLFHELCKFMSIDKIRTSPYKPSTNGNIERFHGTMHAMLAKLIDENQRDWDQKLSAVAFAYRTSVHETTKFTPYFLMHGREARIPSDLVYGPPPSTEEEEPAVNEFVERQLSTLHQAYELTREHLGHAARRRKHHYDLRTRSHKYPVGSWVWVYVPAVGLADIRNGAACTRAPFRSKNTSAP